MYLKFILVNHNNNNCSCESFSPEEGSLHQVEFPFQFCKRTASRHYNSRHSTWKELDESFQRNIQNHQHGLARTLASWRVPPPRQSLSPICRKQDLYGLSLSHSDGVLCTTSSRSSTRRMSSGSSWCEKIKNFHLLLFIFLESFAAFLYDVMAFE